MQVFGESCISKQQIQRKVEDVAKHMKHILIIKYCTLIHQENRHMPYMSVDYEYHMLFTFPFILKFQKIY